jgi:uncharacterized protein involved in type VI secretion and phage assembly
MSIVELMRGTVREAGDRRQIGGVATAIVRDIRDPEGLGRVKVDFPWRTDSGAGVSVTDGDDRAHSYWARIATLFAGAGRGSIFIPEVGDEVLVAFEHGDPGRPIVLGALWNSEDTPPESKDGEGKNHVRAIHSRSGHIVRLVDDTEHQAAKVEIISQGGHKLTLDDEGGQGKIELKTAGGHTLTFDDACGKATLADSGGNKLEFDANAGALQVQVSGNAEQQVGGNLTISVSGSATISAPSGVTLDSSSVKLGTGASLALVNETLLTLFNSHMHVGNMGAPTSPPVVPAVPGTQSTIFVKGA